MAKNELMHVEHPFPAIYDKDSRILILGSFPSVKSREINFFYGHPRNRFWKLISHLCDEACPETIEEKTAFLHRNHIALWDTIASCDIHASSDSSIKNAVPNDLTPILNGSRIEAIYTNGNASYQLYEKYIRPVLGIPATKLPSTSPTNAASKFDDLVNAWRRVTFHLKSTLSYRECRLCPRNCGVDRLKTRGYCQSPAYAVAARAALHPWEEPCISGDHGSGTVFFTGCTLRCCFCQNYKISQEGFGKPVSSGRLSEIFLELQEKGAHNINLVTAAMYAPTVLEALEAVREKLTIPVVYNSSGYEKTEIIRALAPYVSVWLPDLKYCSPHLAKKYSSAENYFEYASRAIRTMIEVAGEPVFETDNDTTLLQRGVIIRHMVLPSHRDDSIRLLEWIADELPKGKYLISIMSQYTPFYHSTDFREISRRITSFEYNRVIDAAIELGLTEGFMQEKSSAKEEYTPPFELDGI